MADPVDCVPSDLISVLEDSFGTFFLGISAVAAAGAFGGVEVVHAGSGSFVSI